MFQLTNQDSGSNHLISDRVADKSRSMQRSRTGGCDELALLIVGPWCCSRTPKLLPFFYLTSSGPGRACTEKPRRWASMKKTPGMAGWTRPAGDGCITRRTSHRMGSKLVK